MDRLWRIRQPREGYPDTLPYVPRAVPYCFLADLIPGDPQSGIKAQFKPDGTPSYIGSMYPEYALDPT